ncbi:2OG-Fe(II) oxygenase [Methylovorus mays]|uniref:2OG-Fe(II) oxygenase n=1 Tax=Methylovorus mays TaxID=184077 RepID=UPI001E3C9F2B|nr:2OG-Fe(II) oxygenase [Methylovorus mays]MCB5208086.1 2OG-Fe(II) oxygenase [Methylovorus mays]
MQTVSLTLPIDTQDGPYLEESQAIACGETLASQYQSGEPFPHIVIDNFLPEALAQSILDQFPREQTSNEKVYERGYRGLHKRQISPQACNRELREVFAFVNSAPVLMFLQKMTGIDGLIPDPYFNGGGFHETSRGGLLGVHSDFRINKSMHLERRLNMIIYLNKDWQPEYGGDLELWDTKMTKCLKKVAPIFNRCVVFNTDEDSNHGHPEPLNTPDGVTRKSMALYYYTASKRIYEDIEVHKTHYKPRPRDRFSLRYLWERVRPNRG